MGKQKKFTNIVGDFNGIGGVTESESLHLPKAEKGTKRLDPGFETIYGYELLEPLVTQARIDFANDLIQNIDQTDIDKINSGIQDYVNSSTRFSYNLDLLKASILNALGTDILTHIYEYSDETVRQIIPFSYFENINELVSIDECWLIKVESIEYYKSRATHYTKKVISEFLRLNEDEGDESDFCVYRGQGNVRYYKNDLAKNFSDTISIFTGIGENAISYFERQVLNSYSINRRVSEKFMMQKNNSRRLILTAEYDCIKENIFSSFIVSDIFVEGQYEFLTLPSEQALYITEDVNDNISAEFHVSDSERTPNKLRRKEL